jgi:hypothetical protein
VHVFKLLSGVLLGAVLLTGCSGGGSDEAASDAGGGSFGQSGESGQSGVTDGRTARQAPAQALPTPTQPAVR